MTNTPEHGSLRIWWVPQIPMRAFFFPVGTVGEASLLLGALAEYDAFQYENNVKPDYCNAGGLQVFDAQDTEDGPGGSWVEWYSESGESIDELELEPTP